MNSQVVIIDFAIGTVAFLVPQDYLVSVPRIFVFAEGTVLFGVIVIAAVRDHANGLRVFRTLVFFHGHPDNACKRALWLDIEMKPTSSHRSAVSGFVSIENVGLSHLLFSLSLADDHAEASADRLTCELMGLSV